MGLPHRLTLALLPAALHAQVWTAETNTSTERGGSGVGVVGEKLYVVGGWGPVWGPTASMEMYDPSTSQWRAGPSMSTQRSTLGVGVLDGKLYAVGGGFHSSCGWPGCADASMEVFDPSTNNWTAGPSMSASRAGLGVGVLGGKLYAVGGIGFNQVHTLASME
eukprot:1940902-Prymnesium_polylepis.1